MRVPFWFILPAGLTVWLGLGHAWAEEAPCTVEQAKINPASVIEPCSKLVIDQTLPADRRAEAFNARATGYGRTERLQLAGQDLDVALKLAPMRSDIYVTRATVERNLGHGEAAWADLKRALSIDPGNARANRDVGQAYESAGDLDEAMRLYTRALATDPAEPYTLLARSRLHAVRHEFKEALTDATAMVDIPPAVVDRLGSTNVRGEPTSFHILALNTRADLFDQIGDQAAADKDYDAALAAHRSPETLVTRAERFIRSKRYDEALKDLDEAVQLDPGDGDAQYDQGLALLGVKRDVDALAALDRAAALHDAAPDQRWKQAYDLRLRASTLRNLGRIDEASKSIELAICMNRDVKSQTLAAMSRAGYWTQTTVPLPVDDAFRASLRACMIDKDCN